MCVIWESNPGLPDAARMATENFTTKPITLVAPSDWLTNVAALVVFIPRNMNLGLGRTVRDKLERTTLIRQHPHLRSTYPTLQDPSYPSEDENSAALRSVDKKVIVAIFHACRV